MNEKQAIDLLIKIAERQQTIIRRLAVMSGQDPNVEYLLGAIPIAAANAGVNNVVVYRVEPKPGGTSDSGAQMDAGYIAFVRNVPEKARETFIRVWDKQLATQKPDLTGRVNITFEG
jgi:hypothetical protein